jgi:hypothetical protein
MFATSAVLAQQPQPPAAANAYLGSAACERCHEPQYDSWKSTLHVQMTKPIAEALVVGDFGTGTSGGGGAGARSPGPVHFDQYGRSYTMEAHDGRYFISISKRGQPAEKFEVDYTLGALRFQGYLSKLPDGRIYVLPIFWHNEAKRWVDYKEITPIPDDPAHDLRQIWNVTCVNCHATNLVKNYNPATNSYATTWTEMGIGCEACHGPGQAHVAVTSEWERNPASKPALDSSAKNPHLGETLKIFSIRSATPRQVFDACGYCHGNKNNVFLGFKAGDRYEDYAAPFLISEPIPANDPQGDFWPDGRPSRFNRPQALTLTGCFQKGGATCTSCHRMHGLPNDHALKLPVEAPGGGHTRQSDMLCTQCHDSPSLSRERAGSSIGETRVSRGQGSASTGKDGSGDWSAHTHHAAESQGSRCIGCHMSNVNWRLITRRLDHTFQPPVPEMTARYGVPDVCTTCHEERSPEWAASKLDEWYGDRERRQAVVAMADTMYRAGAGDVSVLPALAMLAVTRSNGALVRSSAAQFVGDLLARNAVAAATDGFAGSAPAPGLAAPGLGIVNALIGAAADPEPIVRITAVRSLGLIPEPRVIPVLAARLIDEARVVRVRAAEALFDLGVTVLDGPAGRALSNAQDEWAESLRTFNDIAVDHITLGRLQAARGRNGEAVQELNTAIKLNPSDPQSHVQLGILAARAGRYEDALQEFKAVKSLAPAYPNVDRLIEEAQKRR